MNAIIQNHETHSLQSYVSKRLEIIFTFNEYRRKPKKKIQNCLTKTTDFEVVFSRKFSYVKKTTTLKGLGSLALVFLITSRESMAKP
jgi:hypothetical protein